MPVGNAIRDIMQTSLPSLSYQKRLGFRPAQCDLHQAYDLINRYCFDNQLVKPVLEMGRVSLAWGYCMWEHDQTVPGSYCRIRVTDKWYCPQWFMNTLAHEMVHQYQWDIYRWERHQQGRYTDITGSHGPSFFAHRERLAHYGLRLKTAHRMRKWFKYQDFDRC